MLTDRAIPPPVRPDDDPLADPNWQEPEQPSVKLSWFRLLFLILALSAVGAGSTVAVMRYREAGTRVKSWAVPYVDVTLTPTFEFQDPDVNPANDVALAF